MNDKLKIAIGTDAFPPTTDGISNVAQSYAEKINQGLGEAVIVTPKNPNQQDYKYPYEIFRYKSWWIPTKEGYSVGWPFKPELHQAIIDRHFDLLHSHCPLATSYYFKRVAQLHPIPTVLITGESGAGKSEAAVELIKRGHRLIADDAVEIRKVSDKTLIGASPSNIRHFVELRGIGIINARRIFGMGAVKNTEKIDMVIQLEAWDSTKAYDRLGLDNEYTRILDIQVPVITVPITPGRNLAVIVETAAMNNRQKKMGYNAAKELMAGLGMEEIEPEDKELEIWKNS